LASGASESKYNFLYTDFFSTKLFSVNIKIKLKFSAFVSIIIYRGASNIENAKNFYYIIFKKSENKAKVFGICVDNYNISASNIETQTKHSSRKIEKSEKFIFRIIENKAKVFGFCVDNYNIASDWR
jgi:hypothetical protein